MRKLMLADTNALTVEQLLQVAEDDAQSILGVSAREAYVMIERQDQRIAGTILEIELKNIAWLISVEAN